MLGSIVQDLAYASRALGRRRALTLAVVATLTLGIGANTLLFSVVDAVVLSPLPFHEPDRLVKIYNRYGTSTTASSSPDYADRRDQSELLESVAATVEGPANFSPPSGGEDEPRQLRACRVTASFFDVMGVRPLYGRADFPHEDSAKPALVAVLSHGLWQRSFGGDPDAVGSSFRLAGLTFTVQAVMPPGFDYPRGVDLWVPLVFAPAQLADAYRGNEFLAVVGRLREGVTLDAARAEMDAIAARVIDRVPARAAYLSANGWGGRVVPLAEDLFGDVRPALLVLLAAVGAVLAIACANVANMLLASSASRQRELAVRSSLGASRGRLVRQLLTENAVLALAGGAGGLLVAWLGMRSLDRWVPYDLPRLDEAAIDSRVLAFTLLLTVLTGLVFGLIPAWRAAASGIRHASHRVSGGPGGRRLRHALVSAEVAMALVLMIAAGLLLKSFHTLTALEPGFETSQRLTLRLALPRAVYRTPDQMLAFHEGLLDRLRRLPGVVAAGASDRVPLDGQVWTGTFHPEGYEPAPGEGTPGGDFSLVSPGYFETMGIPLLSGRDFGDQDRAGAPGVLVVDEWTAKRFWPDGDAVGRRIDINGDPEAPDFEEIVGVVGHVRLDTLGEEGRMQVYRPLAQMPLSTVAFTVHTRADPAGTIGLVRREVAGLDAELPLYAVRTLEDLVAGSVALPRFNLLFLGAFAALALALAAIGIYGVLSYTVAQRTAEIGVRMAFGAAAGRIVGMVIREGLAFVAVGLVAGTAGALAATRLMSSLLFGVEPTDPATFVAIAAILLVVAFAAACVPAWRAARLDPLAALRVE